MLKQTKLFLTYAHEDREAVREIYHRLKGQEEFIPWMAAENLFAGEKWETSVLKALHEADFVLICMSPRSYNKRGFIQREIREALYLAQEKLESDIFLIPVRLEDCEVEESFGKIHWVNYFEVDGWEKLYAAIVEGLRRSKQAASLGESEQI